MSVTAIVMGRNYTARLGMIRAAGMAGCDVIVVRTVNSVNKDEFDRKSKYVKSYYRVDEQNTEEMRVLLGTISKDTADKIILLPTDDNTAKFIDANQEYLKDRFLYPHVNHETGAVFGYMDKNKQKALAENAGLPVAKGWSVHFENDKYRIPEDVSFPCFVKPQTSVNGVKSIMKKCDSKEELEEHLSKIAEIQKARGGTWEILIEQFIKIDKEYDLPGFANGEDVYLPAFIEKGIIHLGVTGTGKLINSSRFSETLLHLKEFVGRMNFIGLIDIELLESEGVIYFNELNMRFGASGFAMTGAGINLPEMFISALTGNAFLEKNIDFEGLNFASEKVCLQEYTAKKITWKEYLDIVNKSDFCFLRSEEDPKPFNEYKKYVQVLRFKKMIRKFLLKK